jgi:FMN reductase
VERQLVAVEQADVLVVATPVYRGSYTGLFKHFFDFIDQDALVDTPILLAATGGSERHALVIDHQLRPLFSFFQARTLPLGVYATDRDFAEGRVHNEALIQRARLAVQRAMPCWRCPIAPRPRYRRGHRNALNARCRRPASGCHPATRNAAMTTDTFTFSITRIPFNEDYQPAEGTRITTNFANLARGASGRRTCATRSA